MPCAIVGGDPAPRDEADTHRLEVAIHDGAELSNGYTTGVRSRVFRAPHGTVSAGARNRQEIDGRGVRDTGNLAETGQELSVDPRRRGAVWRKKRRKADAEGEHRLAREAEILLLEAQDALGEEARGGHKCKSERHFHDDQRARGEAGPAGREPSPAAGARHFIEVRANQVKCRPNPGHERRPDRDGHREQQHSTVDCDCINPGEVRRRPRDEQPDDDPRERTAHDGRDQAEREGLGGDLAEKARPAAAERRANRQIALAHDGSRKQQIRDVGARNQKQQAGGAEEHPEALRRSLRHDFVHGPRGERVLVNGVVVLHPRRQIGQRPPSIVNRRAGAQTPNALEKVTVAVGRCADETERQPDVRAPCLREAGWRDAHDRERLAVDDDHLTSDVRRAAEAPLPVSMADDRHPLAARTIIGIRNPAAKRGRGAHHSEEGRRCDGAINAVGLDVFGWARHRHRTRRPRSQIRERALVFS